jgi:hypothetical protein
LGLAARRHRVHLGGVDEVDAAFERDVELFFGVFRRILLAERHRSETELGDQQLTLTQSIVLHRSFSLRSA